MDYYISKKISMDFDLAVKLVTEVLKIEGFGVLSEIDIQQKLKEKLDVDFRKYKILGACNPLYAHQALLKENKIGIMLPCNVIVQELLSGQVEISAVDPVASMQAVANPDLEEVAFQIREKLKRVVEGLV